jgi:hypothetical protein
MNKEQYLQYRQTSSIDPVYQYYVANCKQNCLDPHTFLDLFRLWPHATEVFHSVINHYDTKFEVTVVQDLKAGRVLKIY